MTEQNIHPYASLGPDEILSAVESAGYITNGRFLALNSYENRVYQVGIEDARPVVVKFYRPQRWSNEQILEEHEFSLGLAAKEIPVVAPLVDQHGQSLHEHGGFRFAIFAACGGRWPDLDNPDNLEWLGRYLGRIHDGLSFKHRESLSVDRFAREPAQFLLTQHFIPSDWRKRYQQISERLTQQIDHLFHQAGELKYARIHGDCHPGNVLWTEQGPHFVDFDDCMNGPAIQDFWMLISGSREEMAWQMGFLLEGYAEFCDFNPRELHLLEALRTMRMIHYAAWIAKRFEDPAFVLNFPWFNSPKYWQEHILALEEQEQRMDQPPLPWPL